MDEEVHACQRQKGLGTCIITRIDSGVYAGVEK